LRAVDELEGMIRIGARKRAQVMGYRVEIPVGPIPDRRQNAVGVEIERVSAATELGRKQRDPFPEAAPADVGLRVDQRPFDVLALRVGVASAGVPGTLIGS